MLNAIFITTIEQKKSIKLVVKINLKCKYSDQGVFSPAVTGKMLTRIDGRG